MVLILGSKGMLGGALRKLYPQSIAWDREDVDVMDIEALSSKLKAVSSKPSAIINCVAFNDVDGAETKPDIAFRLNTEVPGILAKICKELNIPLVHFTSQLVFDGEMGEYAENSIPHPLSVYGQSKYQGELEIQKNTDHYYIIRTSVLFGPKGLSDVSKKSFVDLMLDLSTKTDTIKAVDDEISSITYTEDLAAFVKVLLEENYPYGIYHITNSGQASWYDMAKEIFTITGKKINVIPVPSTEFPRAAKRPAKAVLLNTKLFKLRPWQQALREFLTNSTSS
jgi:dTDP-4-dehydrorhamnose reductase